MKKSRGNAYVFVVIATVAVLMLASVALVISTRSRDITARYVNYAGLYDLAVAGNEKVLFLLSNNSLYRYFSGTGSVRTREWETRVDFAIDGAVIFYDRFSATTTVSEVTGGFTVSTNVVKFIDGVPSHPVVVSSRINILDDNGLEMVELMRVVN